MARERGREALKPHLAGFLARLLVVFGPLAAGDAAAALQAGETALRR